MCGTFNVNGKEPPAEGLDAWLGGFHPETELFAIGFQELQLDKDAYTGQYLRESSKFIECQERWREAVSQEIVYQKNNFSEFKFSKLKFSIKKFLKTG